VYQSDGAVPFLLSGRAVDIGGVGEVQKDKAALDPVLLPKKELEGQAICVLVKEFAPHDLASRRKMVACGLKAGVDKPPRWRRCPRASGSSFGYVRLRFYQERISIPDKSECVPDRSSLGPERGKRYMQFVHDTQSTKCLTVSVFVVVV
jgi:hypothetical protein